MYVLNARFHSIPRSHSTMKSQRNQIWTAENSHRINLPKTEKISSDRTAKLSRWPRLWFIETLRTYCSSTGLHGLNYLTRPDTNFGERIGWSVIVTIAIAVSITLVAISWSWNSETPTVTVIESTHYATWNVPFPAVTICNFNKFSKKKALDFAKELDKPEGMSVDELIKLFRLAIDILTATDIDEDSESKLEYVLNTNNLTSVKLQELLAPQCSDMIRRCMWKGTLTRCDTLFQPVNCTEGVCCSFNYHGLVSDNYPLKLAHTIPKKPRRVTASGYQTGLTAILDPMLSDYLATYLSGYGFRILIHDSYDFADSNAETKIVSSKTENFISVTPESTYATRDVSSLPIARRECLFPDEGKLIVMQRYSYVNCMAECRSRLFFENCGCIPPRFLNNGSYSNCKIINMDCIRKNNKLINGALPGLNRSERGDIIETTPCDCLPDCEQNIYSAEIATGALNRKYSYNSMNFFKNLNITTEVIIHVFFNDLVSSRYRRDLYQNFVGMLASFGGLLGLIMGFSIVTAFELFYYLTFRPLFRYFSNRTT